jgi:four helix bundle protein
MNSSFEDLRVWRDAMRLAIDVYKATARFPREELYGLTSQVRRAAVSVPSNIAEGKGRRSNREFCRFLYNARGSLLELHTQLLIARELQYLDEEAAGDLLGRIATLTRSINALITSLLNQHSDAAGAGAND